ncbi:MAG: hypothetical protein HDQ97_16115 [Lachnospiraceae bacterium]|nr:hypothetical protein [Lachnospiraceae bacterium]
MCKINIYTKVSIASFLKQDNVKRVAIYGYGVIGKKLLDELIKEHIRVEYMVDKAETYQDNNIIVYRPEDDLPSVDIMIVTPIFAYSEIKQQFCKRNMNIASLGEIIDTLLRDVIEYVE